MRILVNGYTDIGNCKENEDTAIFGRPSENSVYAVVADGLGSHGGGKLASEIAVNSLAKCSGKMYLPTAEDILRGMNEANLEILSKRKDSKHMKTTAVFFFAGGNQAVWAHIGDSRLYHYYNGRLADVTLDHSVCQAEVLLGDITREDIPGHPDRSRLLKVLGDEDIEPEIHTPVTLDAGHHAFLLCTDGFWEWLKEEEILLDLQKSATPMEWLDFLRRRAVKRKSMEADNNTAVAVFMELL